MILSLAPMEGITGHVFRRVHAECFGALDCYYTPFLPPPRVGNRFGGKAFKEIDPANNQGLNVVPQLMSKNADEFVWAAQVLADMGYREVNLNLGCPSGTVVAKGKGSGFLRNLDELEAFLSDVCERSPLPVSVKTRLGLENDDEYERVLDLYCRMPLAELIVHPRVQKDRYTGLPRKEFYGETLERAPFPVAYNGDIFDLEDMDALVEAYPGTRHVMLGRGLLANPALARMVKGGPAATAAELHRFHDTLFAAYAEEIGGNAVFRMKEWWFYAKCAFADPTTVHKLVRKTKKVDEYRAAVDHASQSGVREQAAPQHYMTCAGIGLHQRIHVLKIKNIAVVCHRKRRALQRLAIKLLARRARIAVLLHARVHNQLCQRHAAIQIEHALVFVVALQPQPGFYRHRQRRTFAHIAQEHFELVQVAQKARALALGDNRPRGATQVEIDLAIAHVGEHLCRPHKLVRVLGHQLRHHVEPLVIGRIDLLKRLAAKAVSHPRRRQKRRVIAIERTEALRMHATEHMPGNPLHGGQR